MRPISLPYIIVLSASAITLPLYLILIIFVIRQRRSGHTSYKSPYYVLMISQGVCDIFAMLNFVVFSYGRSFQFMNDLFWIVRDAYIPTWMYTYNYVTLMFRIVGVVLITLQRFFSICMARNTINEIINNLPSMIIICIHISLGLFLSFPFFFQSAYFEGQNANSISIDRIPIVQNTIYAAGTTLSAAILCLICYFTIIVYIGRFKKLSQMSRNSRRCFRDELKLCIQAGGLFIAFMLITTHHLMMFLSLYWDSEKADSFQSLIRQWYQLWSALLSYISPYMIILVNSDIRRRLFCGKTKMDNKTTFSVQGKSTMTMTQVG